MRHGDSCASLTGNEIAALLTHFKLTKLAEQGRLPALADRGANAGDDVAW